MTDRTWSASGIDDPPGGGTTGTGGTGGSGFPPPMDPPGGAMPPPPPPERPLRDGPPWERRTGFGDVGAMFATIRDVLFDAPLTFANMVRDGGFGGPLVFFIVLGTIFGWIANLYDLAIGNFMTSMMPMGDFGGGDNPFEAWAGPRSPLWTVVTMFFLPAILLVALFIVAGIYHLFLMIFGGANESFETTVRVVCYAGGSTAVFQAVPFCGGIIGFVWGIVVSIIGLSRAHETSPGKAAGAVLVPILVCCLCAFIGVVVFGVMAAAALSGT